MKIAIIGGGNMGTAIASGLKRGFDALSSLIISEKNTDRHAELRELEIDVTDSNVEACKDADVILLAVKPQDFEALDVGNLKKDAIVISIMAGVSMRKIRTALADHELVVRVMPNLPALIGKGVSGFFAPSLNDSQKQIIKAILTTLGSAVEVETEDDIDKVTALSGSGPAYIFYFLESLRDAGTDLGLDKDTAEKLALETMLGSAEYFKNGTASLEELRDRVTSKGGTTEKALQVLHNCGFKKSLAQAVKVAYERAKELS